MVAGIEDLVILHFHGSFVGTNNEDWFVAGVFGLVQLRGIFRSFFGEKCESERRRVVRAIISQLGGKRTIPNHCYIYIYLIWSELT